MAGVHQHVCLRAEGQAVGQRRPPVGHVHRVKPGSNNLYSSSMRSVRHSVIGLPQGVSEPVLASADVVLSRVIGAVSEPQAYGRRAHLGRDLDALEQVVGGLATDLRVRVANAPQAVLVLLENIGVDSADTNSLVGVHFASLE